MKKIKEEEVQSEQPELEQATEEPKEIEKVEEAEETSEPAAEEVEPKKEKKGMPRFVKFLLFELLTIVIALGAHFCLLQFVAPILDLNELIEWIIATCASFVLYLVAGYLFNHLIVWKGKGKATFPKFLLSAFLGLVLLLALIHLGIFLTKIIVPTNPLHYSLTALSINHVLAHGGKSTPSGLGILGIALIAMILYSFLIRAFFVFKGEKALKKEEAEEVVEEKKEGEILTHASFRQIVQEELDKFFTSKKKFVYHSQAQSIIDEEIDVYDKKHGKKEEEKKEEEK
ncbi:MAG: hypothetical protein J5627_03420 [Bacilli bacterium]|nr:hypothetical protein [Bacilli bacterium]